MRDKGIKRVLVWVLLLALVIGHGNMAFVAKSIKPTPEPTSLLDNNK